MDQFTESSSYVYSKAMKIFLPKFCLFILFACGTICQGFCQKDSIDLYELGKKALIQKDYSKAIDYFDRDVQNRYYSYSAIGAAAAYLALYEADDARYWLGAALQLEPKLNEREEKGVKELLMSLSNQTFTKQTGLLNRVFGAIAERVFGLVILDAPIPISSVDSTSLHIINNIFVEDN